MISGSYWSASKGNRLAPFALNRYFSLRIFPRTWSIARRVVFRFLELDNLALVGLLDTGDEFKDVMIAVVQDCS